MTRLENYLNTLQRFGIQPGLDRVNALLNYLGQPHLQYPVVLVGGTNGKGSTCEFLANMLAAEHHTVGLYTSPHLYRWNERIRVLSALRTPHSTLELFPGAVSDGELDALFDEALPHLETVAKTLGQTTEFETLTALALWHFSRVPVDVAVIEVGLGGRWDATNVTAPAVSVITHVALDHCDRLGNTLEAIASDKVEIARPQHILVTAETKPQVLQVFQHYCTTHGVRLWPYRARQWSNDKGALESACAQLPTGTLGDGPEGKSQSGFQTLNHNTALMARLALDRTPGLENLTRGKASDSELLSIRLAVPGRVEVLREEPLTLIDGANNPDGAERLARYLKDRMSERPSESRLILVLGILADKDYAMMVQHLAPLAAVVVATQSHSPRAALAEAIAPEIRKYCKQVEIIKPVPAAVQRALQLATPADVICITGSFYTIAEVDREAVTQWKNASQL